MNLDYLEGKKILISGATGFVGQHVLSLLTKSNAEISCLVRASSSRTNIPSSVQVYEADLHSGQGLNQALEGKDMFIHMAALLFGLGWQDYLHGNVLASEVLGKALALHNNLERVVFVSSLAASGSCAISPGIADTDTARPVSAYGWSKFMSEQMLEKYCADKLVTLRPPIIYGSKDKGLLPYFKAAKLGLVITPGFRRKFPVSIIHAHDMARVVALALLPQARGIYHCNDGAEHTMQDIGLGIAKALGKQAKCLEVPLSIMGPSASLMSLGAKLLKPLGLRPPNWNRDKFREAREAGWLCAGTRICDELGFVPEINLEAGIAEALQGYKADAWL